MKIIKLSVVVLMVGVVTFAMATSGIAEEKSWTYGGVEYKLPVLLENVQIPPDLPEYHVVVPGDCLWFISNRYLNDPFLWPLVWEENLDTIQNPHLIYPGDNVKLPGGVLVASGDLPGDDDGEGDDTDGEATDSDFEPMEREPEPFAVTSESAMVASGQISKDDFSGPTIIGAETESFDLATGDVIIMDKGRDVAMEPEQEYFVMRKGHKVYHPLSRKYLGRMYHVVAEASILCAHEETSSGLLGTTYHAVLRGDFLVPKEVIDIPKTLGSPQVDPCNPSTKKYPGTIVDAFEGGPMFSDAVILGKGDIAYIDLGSADGVAPGDYFTIFKQNLNDPRLPRYVSGEAMIVKTVETTSVIVITESGTAIFIGDQIELKQ